MNQTKLISRKEVIEAMSNAPGWDYDLNMMIDAVLIQLFGEGSEQTEEELNE